MNPSITGKDFGEVIGKEKTGVVISSAADADRILGELKPDICIITTQSMMKDVKDIMLACAKNGVNAISTCEEGHISVEFSSRYYRGDRQTGKGKQLHHYRHGSQ